MILFIDTETTGKFNFRLPPDHPTQPRIVQMAAIIADVDGREVEAFQSLVYPDGWIIEQGAAAVHGITLEKCVAEGKPINKVLLEVAMMALACTTVVAHSIEFDSGMIAGECLRRQYPNPVGALKPFCTMKRATDVLKLPGRYGDYKWPSLAETHRHFFGCDFDGAHDAMADARACMKCYFALIAQDAPEVLPQ